MLTKRVMPFVYLFCFALLLASLPACSGEERIRVYQAGPENQNNENWAGMLVDGKERVYLTGGDHEPKNWAKKPIAGNSWVFRFDPATGKMSTVIDIAKDAGTVYRKDSIGHGKFHVAPLRDKKGTVWISSHYYNKEYADTSNYDGSILFSLDPGAKDKVTCHGIAFPKEGTVAAHLVPSKNAYAALTGPSGRLQVYSLTEKKVIYTSKAAGGMDTRLLAQDRQERLYFLDRQGRVMRWDPADGSEKPVSMLLPSSRSLPLRRAKDSYKAKDEFIRMMKLTPDGQFIGVTNYGLFFRFDPEQGSTSFIGPALEINGSPMKYYVPDFALSKDGSMLYYTGGVMNKSGGVVHDNPAYAWNLKTGEKTLLGRLNEIVKNAGGKRYRYNFGTVLAPDETTLYLCPNIAPGRVFLIAIDLDRKE